MRPTPTRPTATTMPMSRQSMPPTSTISTMMAPMKMADELEPIITMSVVLRMGR